MALTCTRACSLPLFSRITHAHTHTLSQSCANRKERDRESARAYTHTHARTNSHVCVQTERRERARARGEREKQRQRARARTRECGQGGEGARERGRDRKVNVMYWASAMFERGCAPERARKRAGGGVGGRLTRNDTFLTVCMCLSAGAGSAGPRRFKLSKGAALLDVFPDGSLQAQLLSW